MAVLLAVGAAAGQQLSLGNACIAGTDFEAGGYRIAHASVQDPFRFLYWRRVGPQFTSMLVGQLYTAKLRADALRLIENARFTQDNTARFNVRIERVELRNCNAAAKTLDLVFQVYSTDPPKFLGGGAESQATAERDPQNTAGIGQGGAFHFTPEGGYDRSFGLYGGGRLEVVAPRSFRLFDRFTAQGQGSYAMRRVEASLDGSHDGPGWLQHATWRMAYRDESVPAGPLRLQQASLSGQLEAATRPFWQGMFFARFGGSIEGGNLQSSAPAGLLALQTVASAGYGSAKGYFGLSSRTNHNVLSASYGLELGSVGPGVRIDWRKHVGDVVDEFWIPAGDHKPFEVETRFTAGGIQVPHAIPLAARFFGGDGEEYFVPGNSWQIRDVPVIRAIPANRFYQTGAGAGADRFAAVNLTLSYPVKVAPIMPRELSTDPEFRKLLNAQIVSAASVEQNYYTWKDPHFASLMARLPDVRQKLDALQTAVNAAQAAHPGQLAGPFGDCGVAIATAQFDVTSAQQAKGVGQYGNVAALVPAGSNDLQAVQDACVGELNRQLNDAGVRDRAAAVDAARAALAADFGAIDQKAAAGKAERDIAFVRRTLNTLFADLNIFSVGPVAVLDAAWIGPAAGALGGTRLGPGGGLRLELASYVNFTVGYAWNVNRQVGEGRGALFFSIGVRDLFR